MYVPPSFKKKVEECAKEDRMTVSNFVNNILLEHAKSKGYVPPPVETKWQRREPPKLRQLSIYIIKLHGLYKIGRSYDPEKRIKSMQLPGVPEVVHIARPVPENAERMLHEKFFANRVYGEWFRLTDEEVELAKAALLQT